MSNGYRMDVDEAYRAVQFYGEMCGIYNIWESIERMERDYNDLDLHDRTALRIIRKELTTLVESEGGEI